MTQIRERETSVRAMKSATFAALVGTVWAANLALETWGVISLGPWEAPAGVLFAGLAFGGREPTHTFADFAHDAGAFVTADDRQRERQITRHEMFVGVTHSRRLHLDQHFAGLWGPGYLNSFV